MDVTEIITSRLKGLSIGASPNPFNIQELMYKEISRKEEMQSKILAGLLNPSENHGYGAIPLEGFLNTIFGANFFNYFDVSDFTVQVERPVVVSEGFTRRIDILLTWNKDETKQVVIIENKLHGASDLHNQLYDYCRVIKDEGFEVRGLVYMPFSKKYRTGKKSKLPDDFDVENVKDFDVEDIIKWLEKTTEKIDPQRVDISTLVQYKTFWECMLNHKFKLMQATEILEKIGGIDEINKIEELAKLVKGEWCEARFNKLGLLSDLDCLFKKKLEIKHKTINETCVAEVFFRPYKYWIELWLYPEEIRFFLVSGEFYEEKFSFVGQNFVTHLYKEYGYYYSYCSDDNYVKFRYDDSELKRLKDFVKDVLFKLEEYKEKDV